jgi:hypothetical protein
LAGQASAPRTAALDPDGHELAMAA